MFTTSIALALILSLLLVYVLLWGLCLRLGLRWVKAENTSKRSIFIAFGIIFPLQVLITLAAGWLLGASDLPMILAAFVQLVCSVLVAVSVIAKLFSIPSPRAFRAWLPTVLAPAIVALCLLFFVRPLLYETYTTTTISMAPTLVGEHRQLVCPDCGRPSYTAPEMDHVVGEDFSTRRKDMIGEQALQPPDRFLVAKFIEPKRWDLLVFRAPEDPTMIYVKRIVGMPGETFHFANDSFWANGQALTPPDTIGGTQYGPNFTDEWRPFMWGSIEYAANLADDEYFVVGDFAAVSRDSRDWQTGAEGHNPYAVPKSHVIGVVTHIYRPLSRFRILR